MMLCLATCADSRRAAGNSAFDGYPISTNCADPADINGGSDLSARPKCANSREDADRTENAVQPIFEELIHVLAMFRRALAGCTVHDIPVRVRSLGSGRGVGLHSQLLPGDTARPFRSSYA